MSSEPIVASTVGAHMRGAVRNTLTSLLLQVILAALALSRGDGPVIESVLALAVGIGMILQGRFLRAARVSLDESGAPAPAWLPWVSAGAMVAGAVVCGLAQRMLLVGLTRAFGHGG